MSVKFNLDSKANAQGEKAIYAFIRGIEGIKTIYFKTDYKILPKYWNPKSKHITKSHPNASIINNALEMINNKIVGAISELRQSGKTFSTEDLKNAINLALNPQLKSKPSEKKIDFFKILDDMIELRRVDLTEYSIKKYKVLKNHLKKFQEKYKYEINFDSINFDFDDKFKTYLINDLKLTNNTIDQIYSKLKAFLNWSTVKGYNTNNQFTKMKTKVSSTVVIFLEEDELMRIYNLDTGKSKFLERVKDIFLLACFTGQRFSDIMNLKRDDIRNGNWFLRTLKTQDIIEIPISDFAEEIINKYFENGLPLPKMSNQKVNDGLKIIGKLAEINQNITITRYNGTYRIDITKPKYEFITFHVARKTFVTLSLIKGMTLQVIMDITGHKDYDTFKKYLKITSQVKQNEMKNIWKKD